jgi:predicted nucleotidyltransferase
MILKDIIDGLAVLNQDVVLNIYQYGSRVYNCATNNSDYDFVIIVQGSKSNYQIH